MMSAALSLSATLQQLPPPPSASFTRQYRACYSCSVRRSYVVRIMFAECLTLPIGRLIIAAHPCVFVAVSRPISALQPALDHKMATESAD